MARLVDPETFASIAHYSGIERFDGLTPEQREPDVFKGYPSLKVSRDAAYAKADSILALRPAPVASGGQHSSENDALIADLRRYHNDCTPSQMGYALSDGLALALEKAVKALSAAPVAETAWEAVDEGASGERIERIIKANVRSHGRGGALTFTGVENAAKVILTAYPPPPVPAQDDDKLRIAVEALEYVKEETRDFAEAWDVTEVCDERIAALKSTAAQEGGAK